jgi:cyclic-di-GMP-binding protein
MSQLPTRKTSNGNEIETRPLYIEEWLDSLPYIDFNKTSALLYEALVATNKATIKSATRIELVELYNRPYQYYVESQIKAGAQHTLQTIDAMQSQVSRMKQIAVALSFTCKIAFDTALNKKTLWKQSKPPVEAMLMSMNYLSHALVFSFLEYAPVPKNVWQQLNFIYDFAESIGCHKKTYSIPGANNKNVNTSIDHNYKKIIMASLVDPHHLPFGAIWEIYDQLDTWAEYTQINPMRFVSNTTGHFVLDLKTDDKPMPLAKFNPDNSNENNRLLDSTPLENLIQKQIDLLQMGQQIDKSIVLSPFYAKSLLSHMLKAWGLPPKRYFPRKAKSGHLNIVTGVSAIYYCLNNGNAFTSNIAADENDEIDVSEDLTVTETPSQINYIPESWRVVDQGSGGYAIIRDDKPKKAIRVGDLVGINNGIEENHWSIGVVRWLMVSKGIHKVGLQIISKTAEPIALCALTGSQADRELRPAFIMDNNSKQRSIIAEKGLYMANREMEIKNGDKKELIVTDDLNESSLSYEVFNYKKK